MPALSKASAMAVSLPTTSYHEARFIPRIWFVTATPVLAGFTVTVAFAVTAAVMVNGKEAFLVVVPEVAETVTVDVPTVAVLLAVSVIT